MRDYLEDGVNAIVAKPHDVADMRAKIETFLAHPEKFAHIGPQAAEWARARFSSFEFSRRLVAIAGELTGGRSPQAETAAAQPTG